MTELQIDPLIERVEQYGKTTVELLMLKSVDKSSEVLSILVSRLLLLIALSFFLLAINIAIALWLGFLLGATYLGFLIVAGFYGLLSVIIAMLHSTIKTKVSNAIISQLLK